MSGSNSSGPGSPPAADSAVPLSFTVHSMPAPGLADEARRTASGRVKMALVLLVCAAPVIASYLTYFVIRPEGRTNYALLVLPPRPVPEDLPLLDLQARPVAASTLRGNWTLVVVSGGACDAACEKRLWIVRQLRETTGRERDRIDKLWLIDDAAAPAPALLATLSAGAPTRVLRAPADALSRWLAAAPGHAVAEHIYVVDPMGNWMMRAPADLDVGRFKRDIDKLLRASSSWHDGRR
jgi:hypothetical protein